jgi:hypothetical protein
MIYLGINDTLPETYHLVKEEFVQGIGNFRFIMNNIVIQYVVCSLCSKNVCSLKVTKVKKKFGPSLCCKFYFILFYFILFYFILCMWSKSDKSKKNWGQAYVVKLYVVKMYVV